MVDAQGNALSGALVAVIPKDGSLERMKSGLSDTNGRFYYAGNPPGEYKVLAWEDIESDALYAPGFLQKLEARAKAVTLRANGHEVVQLTAIAR